MPASPTRPAQQHAGVRARVRRRYFIRLYCPRAAFAQHQTKGRQQATSERTHRHPHTLEHTKHPDISFTRCACAHTYMHTHKHTDTCINIKSLRPARTKGTQPRWSS